MPRVLRIINRFSQEGPIYNAAYLAKHLKGYETLVVGGSPLPHERDTRAVFETMGVATCVIPSLGRSIHPVKDWQSSGELQHLIRSYRPEIIHSHSFGHYGLAARLAASSFINSVKVHTYHGHLFSTYQGLRGKFYMHLEKKLARTWDAQIAISNSQREELIHQYKVCDADKVHLIPLGIDTERFKQRDETFRQQLRTSLKIADDEVCIAIIARLDPIKNHALFIYAIHGLVARQYKIKALVIGDGVLREQLQRQAQLLNLLEVDSPVLRFMSWQDKVEEVLPAVDIVALTSLSEGTPVSLLEAQAASIPIVSTDVGGVRDIMINELTGYLIPNNDLNALIEKLSLLIKDSALRKSMGDQGRKMVNECFSYERLTADIEELYTRLLKQKLSL